MKTTATTYEFWRHQAGDRYAVRRQDGALTGIVGPLADTDLGVEQLPNFSYDDFLEDLPWAIERDEEFALYEP